MHSTISMVWMRMPGQTWPGAAASFIGMWVVMMVAMMLPSLAPMLSRYRRVVRASGFRLAGLTVLVGVGYFFVWTLVGVGVFPLGVALAAVEMSQPALTHVAPIAVGVVVLVAGALQFSAWKTCQLAFCRETPARGDTLTDDIRTAWRHGLRLGLHCTYSCAGLTAIVFAVGVMDLRVMFAVTSAVTLERLAPAGAIVARAIGAIAVVAGMSQIAVAVGLA